MYTPKQKAPADASAFYFGGDKGILLLIFRRHKCSYLVGRRKIFGHYAKNSQFNGCLFAIGSNPLAKFCIYQQKNEV